jgi:hypothetical protein
MALRATRKRLEIDQDATIRNWQCADVPREVVTISNPSKSVCIRG